MSQLGYIYSIQGDYKAAYELCQKAADLDEDGLNQDASRGLIKNLIALGKYYDAKEQIEFLEQVEEGTPYEVSFMHALLKWNQTKDRDGTIQLLDKTVDLFKQQTQNLPITYDFSRVEIKTNIG